VVVDMSASEDGRASGNRGLVLGNDCRLLRQGRGRPQHGCSESDAALRRPNPTPWRLGSPAQTPGQDACWSSSLSS
jgi:hypothetical protein